MTAILNSKSYNQQNQKSNGVNIVENSISGKTSNKGLPLIKKAYMGKNKSVDMNQRYKQAHPYGNKIDLPVTKQHFTKQKKEQTMSTKN